MACTNRVRWIVLMIFLLGFRLFGGRREAGMETKRPPRRHRALAEHGAAPDESPLSPTSSLLLTRCLAQASMSLIRELSTAFSIEDNSVSCCNSDGAAAETGAGSVTGSR